MKNLETMRLAESGYPPGASQPWMSTATPAHRAARATRASLRTACRQPFGCLAALLDQFFNLFPNDQVGSKPHFLIAFCHLPQVVLLLICVVLCLLFLRRRRLIAEEQRLAEAREIEIQRRV